MTARSSVIPYQPALQPPKASTSIIYSMDVIILAVQRQVELHAAMRYRLGNAFNMGRV